MGMQDEGGRAEDVPPRRGEESVGLGAIDDAVAALKRGELIIVVDDLDRENEGDLVMAAEKVTPERLSFMLQHTSGVICVPLTGERLDELMLPPMVADNTESHGTAFTVSVDAKGGDVTTGISAADRTRTIQALVGPMTRPNDLARPGHVFPLRYREGGVLKRAGHTEAAVDLARMAGLRPAGVISEITKSDGSGEMARLPELKAFAEQHGLVIVTIVDLVKYRRQHEKLVKRVSEARLPTKHGDVTAYAYSSLIDGSESLALVMGQVAGESNVLVRVHSECLIGDAFHSLRCDCGRQLKLAFEKVAEEGRGVVVYLRGHEGRGLGLAHKPRAYGLQDDDPDMVEVSVDRGLPTDAREHGVGAQILSDLGITTMRLLTNNPAKYAALAGYNLTITERVPLSCEPQPENIAYLPTWQER